MKMPWLRYVCLDKFYLCVQFFHTTLCCKLINRVNLRLPFSKKEAIFSLPLDVNQSQKQEVWTI